jgi:glutathione synthase/RimK-type ligase-like ATP-grasp enzyme
LRGPRRRAIKLGLAASAGTIGGVADSAVLLQAAAVSGVQARLIDWRGPGWGWPDAVLLHTPWDYTAHLGEFTIWLAAQSARTPVVNPLAVTQGNLHKSYLLDLAAAGIAVPVTRLLRAGDRVDEDELRSTFGASPVVAKPAVGAGGRRMTRLPNVAGVRTCDLVSPSGVVLEDLLLQEFLPAVQTAGEHALVVIAGQVSHLVHKVAAAGEFRVQASHGGTEQLVDPDEATAELERTVLPLVGELAYARVDYIADPQQGPLVMELELTEPDLFLRHHPPAAHRLVEHVLRHWKTSR